MGTTSAIQARVAPATRARPFTLFTALLWLQGVYYLATGVWPLVSINTFLAVTGPKTDHLQSPTPTEADHWLVMTVGVLVAAIGLALVIAALRRSQPIELAVLAITAAIGLTAIDVIYVQREVLREVYLVDAAAEVILILGWLIALAIRRPPGT